MYLCGEIWTRFRESSPNFPELTPREVRLMLTSHQSDSSLLDILPLKFHFIVKVCFYWRIEWFSN